MLSFALPLEVSYGRHLADENSFYHSFIHSFVSAANNIAMTAASVVGSPGGGLAFRSAYGWYAAVERL